MKQINIKNLSPRGFKTVVYISLLPVLLWPLLMIKGHQLQSGTERFLMLAMPVYALASGYLAHRCYEERPYVAWVILAVLWLSYIAFACMMLIH
jgi:hypothetical protein